MALCRFRTTAEAATVHPFNHGRVHYRCPVISITVVIYFVRVVGGVASARLCDYAYEIKVNDLFVW